MATGYIDDKQPDCLRIAQHTDSRGRRIGTHRFNEERPALATIPKEPEPEIKALARSADRSPCTSDKRKVQEDNGVCRPKSNLDGIIGSEIAIHDPLAPFDKSPLNFYPLAPWRFRKAWSPKDSVQFHHRQSCDLAEPSGQRRLAGSPGADDQDALHAS